MNDISVPYSEINPTSLVAIFQLADLLRVTPKQASEIYLKAKAEEAANKKAEPATA